MTGYNINAFGSGDGSHFPQYIEEPGLPIVEKLQFSVPRLDVILKSAPLYHKARDLTRLLKSMEELSSPVRESVKAEEAKIFEEIYRLRKRQLELEDLQESLAEKLYGEREALTGPFGEREKRKKERIRKVIDISFKKLAEKYIENFKKKWEDGTLQPGDIMDFFSAKKLARDSGWDDMLTEIRNVEKDYYKDCLTIPKVIEKKMRSGRKKEREEAEDMLNILHEFAKKHSISFASSPVIKIQIRLLEMEMGL